MNASDIAHDGVELVRRGWRQGSFLSNATAPKVYTIQTLAEQEEREKIERGGLPSSQEWNLESVVLDENDLLVIVSQACDIQKDSAKEPYVEAVRAYWTSNRDIIHQSKRNSVYYFPIKERIGSNNIREVLVVDLRPRLLLKKESLLRCCPISYFDGEDTVIARRFRQWLGRRYLRQALANELVIAVQQPIVKAIRRLSSKDPLHITLDNLREIRFFLLNDTVPYEIEMLFLFDGDSENPPLTDEDAARLANWMDIVLQNGDRVASSTWHMYSTQEISVHDYENAYELALHEFTLPE